MISSASPVFLKPDWAAPAGVHALITTRHGGVSIAPYDGFNLATHVGDDPAAVDINRRLLASHLPAGPVWLNQVHGRQVIDTAQATGGPAPVADAAVTRVPGAVCAIMTADCLPVLFASRDGRVVGAAHAGWRGLAEGVLEATLQAMQTAPREVIAYLGPAIGPAHFEVGPEVRAAFMAHSSVAAQAFTAGVGDRWMLDIFVLARQRLQAAGVGAQAISGGGQCTVSNATDFFSYRRDRMTGRMATLIWRD